MEQTVKDLLKEIKNKQTVASRKVTDFPVPSRQGAERRIREARDGLEPLKRKYGEAVVSNAVIIALDGKHSKELAEIVNQKFKMLAVDYKEVEKHILSQIKKANGTERFGNYEYQVVLNTLNLLKKKYQIKKNPLIQMPHNAIGSSTVYGVSGLLEKTFGELLHSTAAASKIAEEALKLDFDGKRIGVVLYNCSGKVDMSSLPTPLSVVKVDEKPDEKKAESVVENLKSLFGGNKQQTQEETEDKKEEKTEEQTEQKNDESSKTEEKPKTTKRRKRKSTKTKTKTGKARSKSKKLNSQNQEQGETNE